MPFRPSVLVTWRLPSVVLEPLREVCDVDLHTGRDALEPGALRERLADKDGAVAVLTTRFDRETFVAAPRLRIVANVAVGYDNIDVQAAHDHGVIVTNTPDVLTDATADLTFGLVLDVTRRLSEGDRLVRRGGWSGWSLDFMLGTEVRHKQLGIVGAGRIGQAVACRARAFGMRVVFTDRADRPAGILTGGGSAKPGEATVEFAPGEQGPLVPLDVLLHTSDVVSIHVPLTPETRHLIDQRALARMKRTAFLVNTARGPVVDEDALVWALREHVIAGAALDVFEAEPRVHPGLLDLDNVVLVPHLGSATRETRTAMADLAVRNVLAVLGGQPPLTPVAPRS
jgi:lactate dehydrogenase-like 2-hydroxyacid dehydrogenase